MLLLEQHGVVITIEQVKSLGNPSIGIAIRIGHLGLTTCTTLRLNHDDTIRTTRTIDRRRRSILEHLDALNIVGVNSQQLSKLFFIGGREVEVLTIGHLEDVVVHYNQRFLITIDGRGSTQTHLSSRTKVTRVEHNVKTGNLSLQGFIDRGEGETFHLTHLKGLLGYRNLTLQDIKTTRVGSWLCLNDNLLDKILILHDYIELGAITNFQDLILETYVGNLQLVLVTLHNHGEVTIKVSRGMVDKTAVFIHLNHINHHQWSHSIAYLS